jgi:chromosomal replication initiation ATPase DnaA
MKSKNTQKSGEFIMAVALPKYAVAADSAATQLYDHLSSTLPNHYKIIQRLSTNDLPSGTLFCLQKQNRSLLIFICADQQASPNTMPQNTKEVLKQKIALLQTLLSFQKSLFPQKLRDHAESLAPLLVVLPQDIDPTIRLHLSTTGIRLFGHNALMPQTFLELVNKYIGMSMSDYVLDYMHCRFSPESTVSKDHSLRSNHPSMPRLEQFLLSNEQEFALKQDLVLKEGVEQFHQYNLRLIHGIAGSGKSLILYTVLNYYVIFILIKKFLF